MRKFFSLFVALMILAIALPAHANHHGGRPFIQINTGYSGYYGGSSWSQLQEYNYNEFIGRPMADIQRNIWNIGHAFQPAMQVDVFGNPAGYGGYYGRPVAYRDDDRVQDCIKQARKGGLRDQDLVAAVALCNGREAPAIVVHAAPPASPVPAPTVTTVVNNTGRCIWAFGHKINPDGAYQIINHSGKLEVQRPQGSTCDIQLVTIAPHTIGVTCH